jgi:MFS superfamily sulfate permease-like transporter
MFTLPFILADGVTIKLGNNVWSFGINFRIYLIGTIGVPQHSAHAWDCAGMGAPYQFSRIKGERTMIIDFNWIVVLLGCMALFVFWLWQRASGVRGLGFVLIGVLVISGALWYEQGAFRLPGFVGVMLACLVLALLLFYLIKLRSAHRRHVPRYHVPDEMNGRCSVCAKQAQLKHAEQGWLCARCARRSAAKAA